MNKYLFSLLCTLSLFGCSVSPLIWDTSENSAQGRSEAVETESFQSTTTQPTPQAPAPAPQTLTPDVEVIWAIPDSPVEQYTIQYGFTRDQLSESITVSTESLEKYEDPAHGFVYRYLLKGIPAERTIFVSLIARTGSESSPPSSVFEIPGKAY